MAYTKTNWVNGTTPLNDKNMNKIENALENLDTNISKSTDEYSSTSTYSIGELVIYNNKLYKANQDITTAEAFNSSHWTEVTLLSDVNAKQDKLIAGTNITISNNTISAKAATYSNATSSADGLMSKGDKSKLDNILNLVYPIGSIYMSVNSTSPAILFGGTWEQIKDRFLLACGETYKNGETGGEAKHTLTIAEIPSHSHKTWLGTTGDAQETLSTGDRVEHNWGSTDALEATGGGQPHNNMPPYLAVYMWKRTA